MWIWQQTNWPDFSYQAALILPALENVVKKCCATDVAGNRTG
ncbi:DUF4172 domain-containing protein [Candidatus Venteria ishoeyi]